MFSFTVSRQQEYVVVLCYVIWSAVHLLVMILLAIMSCFTVLPYIPARLLLHIVCGVVSIISALVMIKVYTNRYNSNRQSNNYDWRGDIQRPTFGGETNKMDLSKE